MRWGWSVLLAVTLFTVPMPSAHALKIGYVNLRFAVRNVTDGKQAQARLKRMRAGYQKALNKGRKNLEKARKLYMKRRALLRGKAKKREEMKLQKMIVTIQRRYRGLMRKLALAERREMGVILQKMRVVLRTIIRDKGIQLMLEKRGSSLLFAPGKLDHTKELIKRYEKTFAKRGKRRGKKRRKKRRRRKKR